MMIGTVPNKERRILVLQSQYLDVTVTVTKSFWIGKKQEDPNKPRLLKIMVNSLDENDAILRNKSSLWNQDNPEYIHKVFITPDLTPAEQKKNKELRSQLAEMNKAAHLYKIKTGKLYKRESKGSHSCSYRCSMYLLHID